MKQDNFSITTGFISYGGPDEVIEVNGKKYCLMKEPVKNHRKPKEEKPDDWPIDMGWLGGIL